MSGTLCQQPIEARDNPCLENHRDGEFSNPGTIHARRVWDALTEAMLHRGDDEVGVEVLQSGTAGLLEQRNARGVSQDRSFHSFNNRRDQILHVIGARLMLPHDWLWSAQILPLRK